MSGTPCRPGCLHAFVPRALHRNGERVYRLENKNSLDRPEEDQCIRVSQVFSACPRCFRVGKPANVGNQARIGDKRRRVFPDISGFFHFAAAARSSPEPSESTAVGPPPRAWKRHSSPLKKGTGSEPSDTHALDCRVPRGACPLFPQAGSAECASPRQTDVDPCLGVGDRPRSASPTRGDATGPPGYSREIRV